MTNNRNKMIISNPFHFPQYT